MINTLFPSSTGPCATTVCEVDSLLQPGRSSLDRQRGLIDVSGSFSVADNFLELEAIRMPANKLGYFLTSTGTNVFVPPGAEGNYCLGGAPLVRLLPPALNTGAAGEFSNVQDLTFIPVQVGETWNFQAWFRDQNPGNTSNFTDAVSVTFCP